MTKSWGLGLLFGVSCFILCLCPHNIMFWSQNWWPCLLTLVLRLHAAWLFAEMLAALQCVFMFLCSLLFFFFWTLTLLVAGLNGKCFFYFLFLSPFCCSSLSLLQGKQTVKCTENKCFACTFCSVTNLLLHDKSGFISFNVLLLLIPCRLLFVI